MFVLLYKKISYIFISGTAIFFLIPLVVLSVLTALLLSAVRRSHKFRRSMQSTVNVSIVSSIIVSITAMSNDLFIPSKKNTGVSEQCTGQVLIELREKGQT